MGMMQRIRSLSPILVTSVIVLFLLLMILPSNLDELLPSRHGNNANTTVGEVNGEKILLKDFDALVDEQTEQQRSQNAQQGRDEEIDINQIRDRVWNEMVQKLLLRQEAKKAGITVSVEEIRDAMLGTTIPPSLQQSLGNAWTDPKTKQVDMQRYYDLVTNTDSFIDGLTNVPDEEKDKLKRDVKKLIKGAEEDVMRQKMYTNVSTIAVGATAPPANAVYRRYVVDSSSATFNYIFFDASKVSDKDAPVSEQEISDYYNNNKHFFKQKAARKIKYVSFPIYPSKDDSTATQKKVNNVIQALAKAGSVESRDSAFSTILIQYSGTSTGFVPDSMLKGTMKMLLDSMTTHEVKGPLPIPSPNTFLRLDERKVVVDTTVRASHILVRTGEGGVSEDSAKAQVERALARIKAGEDFAIVASQVSQDDSKDKGGDLGFFDRGKMRGLPEFEKTAFSTEVGVISEVFKTQAGYHVLKVTDRKITNTPSTKYSELNFPYNVSNSTKKSLQGQAAELAKQVEAGMSIDTLARQKKLLAIESSYFDRFQNIMNGATEATLFAYENKLGAVSKPMDLRGYGYTVVQVSAVREAGPATLDEDLKGVIRTKLMTRKKLDIVKAKAEQVAQQVASTGALETARSTDTTLQILSAANVKDNGMIPDINPQMRRPQDNILTATVMKMEPGKISGAIRGDVGYYIVKLMEKKVADESKFASSADAIAKSLSQQSSQPLISGWFLNVRDKANIKDNRFKLFYAQ